MIIQMRNKVESREKRVERKTFKPKPLILIICLTTLMLANTRAWGEQEVGLVVNELKVFPVSKLERVAIGDPGVADVTILSEKELMLMAKGAGTTSLIIWDESGQRSFSITVIAKDLEKIAQRIRGLFDSSDIQGLRVKVEEDNVYIIGDVLTEYELKKIEGILAHFTNIINLVKIKERQPLVEIDVNVLEINCEDMKRLGMVWSSSVLYTEPSGTQAGGPKDPKRQTTGKFPKLWRVFKWDRSTITANLNFLINEDKARSLANPKLVTVSGKEASFLVGGEVPYIIVETEGRTSVQWKEYGINLKILPLVNAKNEIKIALEAEVSDLGTSITQQGYSIPSITTRKVQTELFLNEGDTIFLAGLIKNYGSRGIERLPWLSKVPILGELFKSTQFQDKRTELVISLSPRIIGERAAYAEDVAPKMGKKQEAVQEALGGFPEDEEESPISYYSQMIEDIITRSVVYPAKAQEANQEGSVKIDVHLLSSGKLKEAKIKESSGVQALDEAALRAVQEQAPYPVFPAQITQKGIRLTVPVVFKSYVKNE